MAKKRKYTDTPKGKKGVKWGMLNRFFRGTGSTYV